MLIDRVKIQTSGKEAARFPEFLRLAEELAFVAQP